MKKKGVKKSKERLVKSTRQTIKKKTKIAAPFWKQHWQAGLLLFVLPFVLYAASLSFGYVLDDKIVLSENRFVQQGFAGVDDIFSTESFVGYLGEQQDLIVGARYRPLSLATFAIEYGIWGASPAKNHFFNLLFYALTGLLLFRVLAMLLPAPVNKTKWWFNLAFLASVLFLLHPIHTEVVANIKGRDEILTLLFSLGTMYFAIRYAEKGKMIALIFAGFVFLLALMAKENAITFVAVIPLSLYLLKKNQVKKTLALVTVPLLVAFGIYLVIRINVIGYLLSSGQEVTGIMNNPFYGISFSEKYATIMSTLGQYFKLLFFPHPLTHDYYPYQVPIINWGDYRALLSAALYAFILYVSIWQWKKRPVISWSIWYYLLTLSIVSNIVFPVGAPMNERFLFMPSIGATVFMAYVAIEWLPQVWKKKALGTYLGWGILGVLMTGFAIKTLTRVPAWETEMSLNRAAIKVSTNSARANSYMAYSLYTKGLEVTEQQERKQLYEEALPYVNRALEIYPSYSDAVTCKSGLVAGLYQMDGNLDRLLEEFYHLLAAQHVDFLDAYLEYLNGRGYQAQLSSFYHRAGYELLAVAQKNYPLAIKYLNYGIQVDSNNLQLLQDLASVYLAAGRYNESIQIAQRGLQIQPTSPKLRQLLQEASRLAPSQ